MRAGSPTATSLLAECRREERSLPAIESAISTLAALPPPPKPKRALGGDWNLEFASDESALRYVSECAGQGPFSVTEAVILRVVGDQMRAIEIVRRLGPFGNVKNTLGGGWSVPKSSGKAAASEEALRLRWRYAYCIDGNGRERDAQDGRPLEAELTHLSDGLLVISPPSADAGAPGRLVFSRVKSLAAISTEWGVDLDE